jgi:SMC interacting uncharacterized protein involved in chromosome segregation
MFARCAFYCASYSRFCCFAPDSQFFIGVSLTKVVEKIVTKDDGEGLQKHIVELEPKNCKLKAAIAEASEDYEVLQMVSSSLLSKRNGARWRCEVLENDVKKANADSATCIAALEVTVESVKAHNAEVAAAGNKCFSDFEAELSRDLTEL